MSYKQVDPSGPVFVSYRQSDGRQVALQLAGLLKAAGVPVWQDVTDLSSGDTEQRLEQALASGLSGAVLVITPEVEKSGAVRMLEAERLLTASVDDRFLLAVATVARDAEGGVDYYAADDLLGRPRGTFSSSKQHAVDTQQGQDALVRDVLLHRADALARRPDPARRTLTVHVQTRGSVDGTATPEGDLDVRPAPSLSGRLPNADGLRQLERTLGLLPAVLRRSGAERVRVRGGAHLSVAFALGAALPATLTTDVAFVDGEGTEWAGAAVAEPGWKLLRRGAHQRNAQGPPGSRQQVLAYVDLLPGAADAAFARLLQEQGDTFSAWEQLLPTWDGKIDPAQSPSIVAEIAGQLRQLVQQHEHAHLHLLLRCPMLIALHLGRLSNTLSVTAYEWDDTTPDPSDARPSYVPALELRASDAAGPIRNVLLTDPGASS